MRKVILQEFVSLDGLAADPNDSVDFIPNATKGDRSFAAEQMGLLESIDTILLGSVTYRMFAGHWPNVTEGEERVFAEKLNATPKIVFSKKLQRAPWGTWKEATVVGKSPASEVARLKQQSGQNMIIWGSISIAQALMNEALIDEYRIVVCPVVLGGGRRLFRDDVVRREMRLIESKSFDRGAVGLKYAAAEARPAQ